MPSGMMAGMRSELHRARDRQGDGQHRGHRERRVDQPPEACGEEQLGTEERTRYG
jgi:hypothetical protein